MKEKKHSVDGVRLADPEMEEACAEFGLLLVAPLGAATKADQEAIKDLFNQSSGLAVGSVELITRFAAQRVRSDTDLQISVILAALARQQVCAERLIAKMLFNMSEVLAVQSPDGKLVDLRSDECVLRSVQHALDAAVNIHRHKSDGPTPAVNSTTRGEA